MEEENFDWVSQLEPKVERSYIFESRLRDAEQLKLAGNDYFRAGDFVNALDRYHLALYHSVFEPLSWNFELLDKHREQVLEVRNPISVNLASTRLELGEVQGALYICDEVLKETPAHTKARFKRAICLTRLDKDSEAVTELKQCLKEEPSNMVIRREYQACRRRLAEADAEVANMWKGVIKSDTADPVSSSDESSEPLPPKPHRNARKSLLSMFNPLNLYNYFCYLGEFSP